jgi:hypothetical protein
VPALGSAQSAAPPALLLAAFAAGLLSFLLVPPAGTRRVRVVPERFRTSLFADRLERPG